MATWSDRSGGAAQGSVATRAAGALTVDVVRDPAGLDELLPHWDDLVGRGPDGSVYLSRAWFEPWWRHFGPQRSGRGGLLRSGLHLVVVRSGGRPVAILPWLEIRLGGSERILVGIGQETADYGGFLLGPEPGVVLPVVLDHLEHELGRGRTLIDLTRLHPDGALLAALRARFGRSGRYELRHQLTEPHPFVDLAVEDPAALVRRRSRANDVLRRERRLAEQCDLTYDHHRPGRSGADLAAFLDLHERRWSVRRGRAVGLFATPAGQAFLADAAQALDQAGVLRISILRADGRPVASRFGTVFAGAYQGMKSGWDPEYAPYGPGHLVVAHVLRGLVTEGVEEMNMLRGAGEHKRAWADHERLVSYWTLSRSDRLASVDRRALWAVLRLRSRNR